MHEQLCCLQPQVRSLLDAIQLYPKILKNRFYEKYVLLVNPCAATLNSTRNWHCQSHPWFGQVTDELSHTFEAGQRHASGVF